MSGLARPEYLATTEWLSEQLGRDGVRIVDVRWRPDGSAAELHAAAHIPGALHLDWRADLVDADESGEALRLVGPERIAAAATKAAIGDGGTVVVYDDTQGLYAARVWWSLRAYGLESIRVLDGGYEAWAAEGRAVSASPLGGSTALGSLPVATFTPRGPNRMHLSTADVRGLLSSPDVALLDARAPAEYRGFEGNTRRLGHIPGAVNVPVGAMAQPGSQRLRIGQDLRDRLHAANVSRGRRMVTYDGSGVAAAKLAFVLTLMGHEDVAVYDGGWAEWGNRLDLPVDR
ncbi:MAG: sulfurtransferase [Candidatus Limnocylindrales bacterium]